MKNLKLTFKSTSEENTIKFGERLGAELRSGHVVALIGELGAGKTTLIKGIVRGLGVMDRKVVKSPTFSLLHIYKGRVPVYHFDAYRLKDYREMLDIGSNEMIYGDGVSIIEWADKVLECLPNNYLKITICFVSEREREIELYSTGKDYDEILHKFQA